MDPTDAELYTKLIEQLGETGGAAEASGPVVIEVSGLPGQRVAPLRLHLTPAELGRALRDLAPVYGEQFPLLPPLDAALIVFYLQVLQAAEDAGGPDIVLQSSETDPMGAD